MKAISTNQSISDIYNKTDTLKVVMLATTLVIISSLLQCNIGIKLADEGYLWYGAEQTLQGRVPLRDFQSYDPGRYYWCAFWMKLFGNGIISLRLSLAIFQTIGLSLGLLALKRYIRSWKVMVLAASIMLMWMIPRHKLFDCSLSIAAVFFALRLIENPSLRQHFISGIFIGLAAFFGRNHGLYNFLAFGMLMLFIRFKLEKIDILRSGFSMGSGILLGYSPMLIMMLIVPGFFDSFFLPLTIIFRRGSTNLFLPIPWPWRFDYSKMNFAESVSALSVGFFFMMMPLVHIHNIINLLVCKKDHLKNKLLLAVSSFVGVVYMHHAFSRADIGHRGQGIAPLMIAVFAIPSAFGFSRKKMFCVFGLAVLVFMTLFSAGRRSEFYAKATSKPGRYVKSDIAGDTLWLPHDQAKYIQAIKGINSQMISPEEGFLVPPWQPGMYPVLQRESPLWDIYFLFPETEPRQEEMIKELRQKKVNWALLSNLSLDGREDLKFSNTHKLLWNYFMEYYQAVKVDELQPNYMLLYREPGE
jgi:hypothetical protein